MKILLYIIAFSVFSACSTAPNKSENTTVSDTTTAETNSSGSTESSEEISVANNNETAEQTNNAQTGIPKLYEEIKSFNDLPSWLEIDVKGQVKFGAKWKDDGGENVLLINITDLITKPNSEEMKIELFGMHYVMKDKKSTMLWHINDAVTCEVVDIDLFYVPNSFMLTDLNGDGIRETTVMYQLMCRGDVSPDELKLIMHDGKTKYAIRGNTKVDIGNGEKVGGEMNVDKSFDAAPKGYKEHAISLWKRFVEVPASGR